MTSFMEFMTVLPSCLALWSRNCEAELRVGSFEQ